MAASGAIYRRLAARGNVNDMARAPRPVPSYARGVSSMMAKFWLVCGVAIAWFVAMWPTAIWGFGFAWPPGSVHSTLAYWAWVRVILAIHLGIMVSVGCAMLFLPLGQFALFGQDLALWDLVWAHHREALCADPAATEQQSILHVQSSMQSNPAVLQRRAHSAFIARANGTPCRVILQYVAPLFPLNLAFHTTVCVDQVLGWVMLAIAVPLSAMYMLFAQLALKSVPLLHEE